MTEAQRIAEQVVAQDRRLRQAHNEMPVAWAIVSVGLGLAVLFVTAAILERIG